MTGAACKDCRYIWTSEVDTSLQRQYVCRRFPPTTHILPGPGGPIQTFIWPIVGSVDFCGEFKAHDKATH